MGYYTDHVLPRLMNCAGDRPRVRPLRRRVCDGLSGTVVEIGFGSGLNVPYYPRTVTSVTAVEPSDVAWTLARERIQAGGIPVLRSGLDGESLPFPDDSYDVALSTWTLCTIPDVAVALGELRRVLKPGGSLHFLEHGLAPDEKVRRWQRRLRADTEAGRRRVPSHPTDREPPRRRRVRHQGSRRLLRGRSAKVGRRVLPRPSHLAVATRAERVTERV